MMSVYCQKKNSSYMKKKMCQIFHHWSLPEYRLKLPVKMGEKTSCFEASMCAQLLDI